MMGHANILLSLLPIKLHVGAIKLIGNDRAAALGSFAACLAPVGQLTLPLRALPKDPVRSHVCCVG